MAMAVGGDGGRRRWRSAATVVVVGGGVLVVGGVLEEVEEGLLVVGPLPGGGLDGAAGVWVPSLWKAVCLVRVGLACWGWSAFRAAWSMTFPVWSMTAEPTHQPFGRPAHAHPTL